MVTLPDLPYDYKALEPIISEKIMRLHHDKHHAGYIEKLNTAIKGTAWENSPIENMLQDINDMPLDIKNTVQNNGGGHINHTLFWESMIPLNNITKPSSTFQTAIEQYFTSLEEFQKQFIALSISHFGSGWVWLVEQSDNTLAVYDTTNQDSPYLKKDIPLLGIDVWEHAYYLDYLNDRASYVQNWWKLINWKIVDERLNKSSSTK